MIYWYGLQTDVARELLCQLQARIIAQKLRITNFGGSVKWVYAFMHCNNLSIGYTVQYFQQCYRSKDSDYQTTGNEIKRFTIMLACTPDRGKLQPFAIFKRKTLPKNVNWPEGILIRCQDKDWMDDTLMRDWIKNV